MSAPSDDSPGIRLGRALMAQKAAEYEQRRETTEFSQADARELLGDDLYAELAEVMLEAFIPNWLNTPLAPLAQQTPAHALRIGRHAEVGRVVALLGSGIPT